MINEADEISTFEVYQMRFHWFFDFFHWELAVLYKNVYFHFPSESL